MIDDDAVQLLTGNPAWLRVLWAYHELSATNPAGHAQDESGPRWFDRIPALDELEASALAAIHGQLIAQGWLKVQLEDGKNGLTYRVSSEGRAALERAAQDIGLPEPSVAA